MTRTTLRSGLLLCALVATVQSVCAQAFPINLADKGSKDDVTVKLPVFEVASVKPNKSGSGMMQWMTKQDGFSCQNISLKSLISGAYGVRPDLISGGTGWVDTQGFDVEAKVAGEDVEAMKKLTGQQRNSMLQALLADRFHLKVHTESKVLPMYDLVIAKSGPKLKEIEPENMVGDQKDSKDSKHRGMMTMGPGMFKGESLPMKSIANQISYVLEKTVNDKTGLKGTYDLDLKWTPEDAKPSSDDGSSGSGASIFTAVQEQLGLKLVSTKGPVETLVIDHVELPTEN